MPNSSKVYDTLHALERGHRYRAFHPETHDTLWAGRFRLAGVNADVGIIDRREEVERYFAVTGWNAQRRVRPLYQLIDPNDVQVDIPPDVSVAETTVVIEALMADYAWASPSRPNVWGRAAACTHGWFFETVSSTQQLPVGYTTMRFFRDAEAARSIRGLLEAAGVLCRYKLCGQP